MSFIAVQTGARRNYAVPAILEQAGMLERFYTDICGSVGLGAVAGTLRRAPGIGPRLQRLYARQLPATIVPKTRTFAAPVVRQAIDSWRANGNPEAAFRFHGDFSRRWGSAMIRAGFGHATHVFSMLGEGGPFIAEAKRRGLSVVSEVYILLSTLRIVAAERQAFPQWEPPGDMATVEETERSARAGLLANSDYFICPSVAVRDDLVIHWEVDPQRTALVPYGMDPRWLELEPQPICGRVLFVGTAELRKGIHYLAMAAERLNAGGREFQFRVAGQVSPRIAARPECRHLNFLGRVPRQKISEEFQRADVLVLPSLAEGSAEVTYEALAAGVPVITTAASGSVVRDGVDGRIVPERDVAALAAAIAEVVSDRPRRDELAAAGRVRAADYIWQRYGERLIAALQGFSGHG